jgi:hypothetical protein
MDVATGLGLTASRLVILQRRPYSVTVTRWFNASFRKVAGSFAAAAAHELPHPALLETGMPRQLAVAPT